MTENQLVLLVHLMQESKEIHENKEKMSDGDKKRFEELRLKKIKGEELRDDDKQFLKKYESLWQKTLNLMRANPKGFSVMKGLKGLGDEFDRSSAEIGSLRDLYI